MRCWEWIRQQPFCSGLMVHLLTLSNREAEVARAYALGANSYVVKPSRMDELIAFARALEDWHRFVRLAPPYLNRGSRPGPHEREP